MDYILIYSLLGSIALLIVTLIFSGSAAIATSTISSSASSSNSSKTTTVLLTTTTSSNINITSTNIAAKPNMTRFASISGFNTAAIAATTTQSNSGRRRKRSICATHPHVKLKVISPTKMYINVETQILFYSNTNLTQISVVVQTQDCLILYQRSLSSVLAGRRNDIPVVLKPSHSIEHGSMVKLYVKTDELLLHERTIAVFYPKVHLWASQLVYSPGDSASFWVYSSDGSTLPVPGISLAILVQCSREAGWSRHQVTTDQFGLARMEVVLSNQDSQCSIQVYHMSMKTLAARVNVTVQHSVQNHLDIDITSTGYRKALGVMSVNVRVRRPASMSVTGRAKVSYCQPNCSCQRVEMNIVDGHGVFMPHIDLDTATSSDTLAVTVTVVEYKTGITEMSTVHLLIFLEHLHIHVDNVPAQFTNGSHLRVPVSVTRADNSPATQECLRFKISTASSPSTLLYSRDQRSDSRGEAVAFWDIPSTLSQDLKIQVNGCDGEATPIELTVAYSPHRVVSLDTHRHRYVVGDVIRVNITDSQPDHQLLVRRCAGDILDVMSIQTEHMLIHVTALMYPCLVLSMVQWALSENNSILSSLTIDIDNPLNYQLESDRGEYSLGTQATVSLTPNLLVDSRLLLLAAGSKNSNSTFPTSRLTAERDVKVVATETSACSRQLSTYRCNSSLTTVSSNNSSTTMSPHNPLHSANQSSSSLHRLRHQRSRSRSRPQSEVTPSVVEETTSPLPQRDWLPDRAAYRALGLPDHWLGRNKRSVSSCITYLSVGRTQLLPWCQQQDVKLRLPQYEPSDWLLTGLLVTSRYGMQPLSTLTLRSVAVAHLVIKSPPSQLVEGEQFQLHITVMSYNITHRLHAHVRLILSEEEAFCFGDLLLNSYPHVNVTLDSHSEHAAASFTATSLLEGNFSVAIELWVNELKIGQEDIQLTVARPASNVSEIFPTSANPLADWSTPPFPSMNSGNLELKMRYNQQSNQQRCKGFRLKINHEIYEEPAQPAPSSSFADFLGRRRRSVATHLISSVPRHSLLICYKILQRSAQGSYYIDVESFAGYRAPLELSTNVNCTVRVQNMQAYDRGTIIMIENSVSNDSWCCLNMLLESSSPDTNVMHTQFNQSASVRMHDVNRPGDFCLEFYNLHARSPYSNHICSQHGCLCTESTLGTCKRLKSSSMRRTMLTITRQFLEAKHKFEVTPSGQGQTLENGLQAQLVTVLNSYGASHIAAGQHLLLYYKQRKKKCLLFASNSTFIVMGRQLHIQADDSRLSYMYLEQQSSVINTEELKSRNKILSCFLSVLFCPISSALNFSHLFINSTAESISTSIHSTCRYRQSLVTNGAYETYASRYDLDDFTCQPDLGHVFHLQSTYQSIRRRRRRHRRRKFMNEFLSR